LPVYRNRRYLTTESTGLDWDFETPIVQLGITDAMTARPIQAASASAGSFVIGAALPLLLALLVPVSALVWTISDSYLLILALLGFLAAIAGGSPVWNSIGRVTFWGALAMALTAGVGALFGKIL